MSKNNTDIKMQNLNHKEMAMRLIKKHLTAIVEESMDAPKIAVHNAHMCAIVTADMILNTLGHIRHKNLSLYEYWSNVADVLKTEEYADVAPEEIF